MWVVNLISPFGASTRGFATHGGVTLLTYILKLPPTKNLRAMVGSVVFGIEGILFEGRKGKGRKSESQAGRVEVLEESLRTRWSEVGRELAGLKGGASSGTW
jgi:hypothetical protein